MKTTVVCLSLAAIISLSGCSSASNPQAETAALTAAGSWLSLVDEQKYDESWDEAAQIFMGVVTKEQWTQQPFSAWFWALQCQEQ
ncbi:MAG: DUF4019 domain-containing protein [Lentisphaerales bacterium]|jgi:hypothetical protein|nr:MAG: DUF4019 domain-containing protein [Lentisphaerales bacterium]